MSFIFGIDGGGTGCRVALADGSGKIISEQQGGPANIETSLDEARTNIIGTCKKALTKINLPENVIKESYAVLGLAGSNMGNFDEKLSEHLPFKDNLIINDGEITLQGAIGTADGCIAAIGTGSVFIGRVNGVVTQIGGWGFALGDDGSGAILGQNLLRLSIRCHENLERHSDLTRQVMQIFGNKIINLIKETYDFKPKDFAQFASLVFESNLNGDYHAYHILRNQIPIIENSIISAGFNKNSPFCLLGGLGEFYKPLIKEEISRALVDPKGNAVDGAISIATSHYKHYL